ncbi:glycosyltransferase family A protein [Comamonas sp. lk]|uniref:glycosyltransferase family 2 protein n=1 Tax=Comamonas sp. lk TaxID=2201272 RepID=UPI000EB0E11E|nr:glycosyltransferase family A protein [Comamonas sp. lk]
MLRALTHLGKGEFAKSLAAVDRGWSGLNSWQPLAYYRLGMYRTVADMPLPSGDWRYAFPQLVSLAACGQHEQARSLMQTLHWHRLPQPLRQRLRVSMADALAPLMPLEALQLFETGGERTAAHPALHAALLLCNGRLLDAQAVLKSALATGQASRWPELHLYQTMAEKGEPQLQLQRLNAFMVAFGLPALELRDGSIAPSPCNVMLSKELPSCNGPLVSVLMTTFRTKERASVAIESLLNQSYRNLEIIVVDDASGDETPDFVDAWARRDARVRLLRLDTNGGTYLAKSMGLQLARGEFVTCHDSDDWSHPLKIELQVRPLLEDASLVATTSHWVRMTDDGMFYARPVHSLMRLNPSSPLFRRELVLQRMGAWDCVRTGADSEFLARLRLVFGKRAIKRIAKPLALGSHRVGSLMTAGDTGYSETGVSPQRLAYWEAWSAWHLDCLRHDELPCLPLDMQALAKDRPFPAPAEICVSAQQKETTQGQMWLQAHCH